MLKGYCKLIIDEENIDMLKSYLTAQEKYYAYIPPKNNNNVKMNPIARMKKEHREKLEKIIKIITRTAYDVMGELYKAIYKFNQLLLNEELIK